MTRMQAEMTEAAWRSLALLALLLYTLLWVAPVVLTFTAGVIPYWLATGRVPVDRLERLISSPRFMDTLLRKAAML